MPKIVDLAERRGELAEAAIAAIDDLGLDGLRLRDVARAAGATTGAVTHYFDGKDALLEAALDAIMERLLARAGEARAGDGVAHAAAALPIDSAARREWRVWLAFCGRAVHAPRLRARHADHYRRIVDALRQAGLDRESADAVVAAIDGVGLRATLEPDDWPPARQVATLERLLRPLLARKDP